MGLYTDVFGEQPSADALLACLGLTRSDVGRFRDAGVAEGRIYVYTRNGGGNRGCWCEWGTAAHDSPVTRTEQRRVTKRVEATPNTSLLVPTDEWEDVEVPVCQSPSSEAFDCVGCFMTYRVAKLPYYVEDRDDEFDETYATIYFDFPPAFAEPLRALDAGEPWNPDERWAAAIERLRGAP